MATSKKATKSVKSTNQKSKQTTSKSTTKSTNKTSTSKKNTKPKVKKPVVIGNVRSALARQVIEGTYDKRQCITDIKSFTSGISEDWRNGFIDFLKTKVTNENYFRALCNNALTNSKHNYDGIPVIRYWEK